MSGAAVRVRCPATSANLGPGFDALGLALGRANLFEVSPHEEGFTLDASGEGAERLQGAPADNVLVRAFQAARAALGLPPARGLRVRALVGVPPSRGLGSSATAAAAGALAASALATREGVAPLSPAGLLDVAAAAEGHPDNVAPCLLGGLCVAVSTPAGTLARRAPLDDPPGLVLAIPRELELSTAAMRLALPASVPFADAVANVGRTALLLTALATGDRAALAAALEDRLHQPYRGARIPGFEAVRAAAREAGALGTVISGSGPTLLAFTAGDDERDAVARAMEEAWRTAGVEAHAEPAEVDRSGARVEP